MQNSDVLIIFQEFFSSYQFLLLLKCVSAAYAISSASERARTHARTRAFLPSFLSTDTLGNMQNALCAHDAHLCLGPF